MAKIITAQEAAKLIPDHCTVGFGGQGLAGWPEEISLAIRDSFAATGHPCDLNVKHGCTLGNWGKKGLTHLGEAGPGLVTRWCGAHVGSIFALRALAAENKLQLHCLPQGVIVNLWREIAAGRPGLITKVGLGTFVDPRNGGGKINEAATDELVELIHFQGEEYLFYKSFPLHVAIIRGTIADENGNITMEDESFINEAYHVACAAKNSGGITIAQVKTIAKKGTLHPKDVVVPGVLVDYIVQCTDPENHWQTEGVYLEPAFSGSVKKPLRAIPVMPFDEKKVLCRRCAMELKRGYILNLGVGIPADLSKVVNEEGYLDFISTSTEVGNFGGVASALPNFGATYNAEASVEHGNMFDFIDGGGLDMTCLGIGEIDEEGNNNVSYLGDTVMGPGGFIDISQNTPKIVFCGTFMDKAKIEIKDGKVHILEQGKRRKFVKKVKQITFAGKYARDDQNILYVTERCVFRLVDKRLTLVEIAPGIDLGRDILANMDFKPAIADNLKLMDPEIFQEHWGGLGKYLDTGTYARPE